MLKKLFSMFFAKQPVGEFVGRARTRDVAITYRMGAGFPGDVNRSHPASIEPCLVASAPPKFFGEAMLIDANGAVRPFTVGDEAVTSMYGMVVRPFPIQTDQAAAGSFGAQSIGSAVPPSAGVMDILRNGYGIVKVNGAVKKGSAVYVWCAVASGAHVQGGFEAAASAGNTAAIANAIFNGVPDASGYVEVYINN